MIEFSLPRNPDTPMVPREESRLLQWVQYFQRSYVKNYRKLVESLDEVNRGSLTNPSATVTGSTYTVLPEDGTIYLDGTSNTVTVTLPTAVGIEGRRYNFKCIDATNTVELAADGTEEIDGSTTNISFALHESVTVESDGSNWWII